jgi:hypothetical protein
MNESPEQPTRRELAVALAVAAAWAVAGFVISQLLHDSAHGGTMPAARAAVCRVHNGLPGGATNVGSGTLIDVTADRTRGLVLTCAHLFTEGCGQTVATFPSGRSHGALLIGVDRGADLAALEIANPQETPAAIGSLEAAPEFLTACGFGPAGAFRCVAGSVVGVAESSGQVSLKLAGAVRSGDSGGGAFDGEGRLVGVIWGQRDGVSYVTSGGPLKRFVEQVLGRRQAPASQTWTAPVCPNGQCPLVQQPVRSQAPSLGGCSGNCDCRRQLVEVLPRVDALERTKQERGEYLTRGDLSAYAPVDRLTSIEKESRERHESVLAKLKAITPGVGALATTALGVSGPSGWGIVAGASIGSWLVGRRLARRRGVGGRRDKSFRT